MDLKFTKEDESFRKEVRNWLKSNLCGKYAKLKERGGPGDEHSFPKERQEWEQKMGKEGFNCLGWPEEFGGRNSTLMQEVIFYEEYARIGGPGRLNHIGEGLLGPTLIAFGSKQQQKRFLPSIVAVKELWCQGYSEPNAGSDLANVQTKATLINGKWHITGQKTWTSHAHIADFCFVLCRTDSNALRHKGLSYLLVPMRQKNIDIRPIKQLTATSEFNEVFFDNAITDESMCVGGVNNGWSVAMATLSFERGVSTLGQQLLFENEFKSILFLAKKNGSAKNPSIKKRLAQAFIELKIMRLNALRTLSNQKDGTLCKQALINKLYWSTWHRNIGELAMDVLGEEGLIVEKSPYELNALQRLFLFSRADTIYAGSSEIQRNIIAERALGLPKEPIQKRVN